MNRPIVFFDIDGTLLDEEKNLPKSTELAIDQLKKNGVEVVFATGRPPFLFKKLREKLGIHSYVSYTGQYVVFEGEKIYENPLSKRSLIQLHEDSISRKYPMVLMSSTEMRATVADHPHVIDGLNRLKFQYPEVDLTFHERQSIFQVLLFKEKEKTTKLMQAYEDFHFIHWGSDGFACDVLPKGGSKAVGIEKILDATGIRKENSFAFGDGMNDLEMIQAAGTGIAMGNAVNPLKDIADDITGTVNEDGIQTALKKYGLI